MQLLLQRLCFLLLTVGLLCLGAPLSKAAGTSELQVITAGGRYVFKVELAANNEERAQGLMYRRELSSDAGMLFDMGPGEHEATFWMKNTLIPLDMIFIRADGTIRSIAERTVPESLATVPSNGPVRAVLEVNGGTAARLGIKPGDKVIHPLFEK